MMSGMGYPKENAGFYKEWWQCKYFILLKSNFNGELKVLIVPKKRQS